MKTFTCSQCELTKEENTVTATGTVFFFKLKTATQRTAG